VKSKTLDHIDNAAAWVEGSSDRATHWLRCHFSWAWRQHATEETFTFTFAVTGKLRERARNIAMGRIRKDLKAMGANGPFVQHGADAYLHEVRKSPDWLDALPPTGVVHTPPIDHEREMHEHKATFRR
jgi:hypothetical protein